MIHSRPISISLTKSLPPLPRGYSHILAIRVCAALDRVWFQAIYSGIGTSNHRKLVKIRVPFKGEKQAKSNFQAK